MIVTSKGIPESISFGEGEETTIDISQMNRDGGRGLRDAVQYLPNVTGVDAQGSRVTTFTVRGAREPNYQYNFTLAPAVSVYRNGLPSLAFFGRSAPVYGSVEEIRFLRGPQGARFGAGGSAGLLEIRHRRPEEPFSGHLRLETGSYEKRELDLSLQTVTTKVPVRASLDLFASQREGWYDNAATGDSFGAEEWLAGRVRLSVGNARENLEIALTLEVIQYDGDFADVAVPFDAADLSRVNFEQPGFEKSLQDIQAIELIKKAPLGELRLITGRQGFRSDDEITLDVTGAGPPDVDFSAYGFNDVRSTTWTQELRFLPEREDPKAFGLTSAGAFIGHSRAQIDAGAVFRTGLETGEVHEDKVEFELEQETLNLALFSEWLLAGRPGFDLTLGLRGEADYREGYGAYRPEATDSPPEAPYPPQRADRWFLSLQPVLTARWNLSIHTSAWAKFSTGYRPGGFNVISLRDLPFTFDDETSYHFELGLQWGTLASPIQARATAYYTWYDGYHAYRSANVISQGIVRAENAYAFGGELESILRPWRDGAITLSAGLTEARFDDFVLSYHQSDPGTGEAAERVVEDFSGNRINYIPRANLRAAFEQRLPLRPGLQGVLAASYTWNSGYHLGVDNEVRQGGYGLLDARIGLQTDAWEVTLFARNLTDEGYFRNAFAYRSGIIPTGAPGDPRLFGVSLKFTW
ncbi:MAG: TonB-dependent receptor [Chthoniobacteraceae bacterium]